MMMGNDRLTSIGGKLCISALNLDFGPEGYRFFLLKHLCLLTSELLLPLNLCAENMLGVQAIH
jgi:hypothetical protein